MKKIVNQELNELDQINLKQTSCDATTFVTDIVSCKFSATVDYQYLEAIQNGLKLSSKYSYSDNCVASAVSILDDIYGVNYNVTEVAASTTEKWQEAVFNVSGMIGTDVNGGVYNCYLFWTGVIDTVETWSQTFVDETDIYTSFLFNLLAEGLQLRSYILNMETYYAATNYVDFIFTLASMLRVVLNFSSSNGTPLMKALRGETQTVDQLNFAKNMNEQQFLFSQTSEQNKEILKEENSQNIVINKKNENVKQKNRRMDLDKIDLNNLDFEDNPLLKPIPEAQQKVKGSKYTLQESNLISWLTYIGMSKSIFPSFQTDTTNTTHEWDGLDVANLFLGVVDGGLSAFPSGSNGYYCGKNASNTRLYLTNSISYFNQEDLDNGFKQLYDALNLLNGITVNCYYAFSTSINTEYINSITADGLNYLEVFTSNIGYMYADIFNIVTNNWQTQQYYSYYLGYNVGDLILRLIYSDLSATSTTLGVPPTITS